MPVVSLGRGHKNDSLSFTAQAHVSRKKSRANDLVIANASLLFTNIYQQNLSRRLFNR